MSTIAFDTLKFVEKLESGGFTHAQAKAAAEAFAEATSQELAVKGDLREAELRLFAKIDTEIAGVKGELALLKWMLGFALALLTAIALKLFLH
ncbi:DUF1640 domain-containing protein [Methylocystis sp. JAN1]|uniref:DUF1640 domain-containing protein n=1 Tax=Methylocystis sp. JAN1 TaxID=3397211 RepID=UPI003FA2AF81